MKTKLSFVVILSMKKLARVVSQIGENYDTVSNR